MALLSPSAKPFFATRGPAFRLSLLHAANFASVAIWMPFFPPWLAAQGLNEKQIGLALALAIVVRIIASPPVTALADGPLGAVRILAFMQAASAAMFLLLPNAPTVWPLIAAVALVAALGAPTVPLADHLTIAHTRSRPSLDYGRIRVWGSISFLGFTLAGGWLLTALGIGATPYLLAALCLMAAVVAVSAPEDPARATAREEGTVAQPDRRKAKLLWLGVAASALVNAAHGPLYAFGSIHWSGLGFTPAAIGLVWATGVVAEIALFWLAGPRAGKSAQAGLRWLLLAAIGGLARFAIMPFVESYPLLVLLQASHALTFGAQLMGVMILIGALAPEGRTAGVQGRLSAVNAVMIGATTYLSGLLYASFGAWTFAAAVPLPAIGIVILLIALAKVKAAGLDSGVACTLATADSGPAPRAADPS